MLHNVIEDAHHVPAWVKVLPIVVGLVGIALAWYAYLVKTDLPARFVAAVRPVHRFVFNKWYFDELYDLLFVRSSFAIGRGLWKTGDGDIIDGVGPDGMAATTHDLSVWASRLQSGYLYHYAFAMMIGLVALATWFLVRAVW